jgi:hypothetical protein
MKGEVFGYLYNLLLIRLLPGYALPQRLRHLGRFAFFPAFSAFWSLFLVCINAVVATIAPMTSLQ